MFYGKRYMQVRSLQRGGRTFKQKYEVSNGTEIM